MIVKYCGTLTFLAIFNFQVLKATTMTSVMFLQDLKSKNTQVSRTGQCAPCINWQRLTVLFLYQCSQLWILLQIGRISRFLDNLADPCSEIQIFAEQSYLSSSTSNSAFSGTLYRERTNTSSIYAISLHKTKLSSLQSTFGPVLKSVEDPPPNRRREKTPKNR